MKLLSIAIPCYNSEKYMRKCIDSLLIGGEDVEILIIDDGSTKDRTAEIADEYEAQFPTIVRAIHKENGGHGSAVNTGIANATGLYFKVVDSDDWVKQDAYFKILDTLRELAGGGQALDMLISNYVYEKEGERRKKVIQYRHILPVEKMFTWTDCHHFLKGHYILMHSVIFRTRLLQECGLKLPEHTFYVDNLYVFEPLPYVKNMYYLDVNFYRYYIGRQDQSVNETVMISRIARACICHGWQLCGRQNRTAGAAICLRQRQRLELSAHGRGGVGSVLRIAHPWLLCIVHEQYRRSERCCGRCHCNGAGGTGGIKAKVVYRRGGRDSERRTGISFCP